MYRIKQLQMLETELVLKNAFETAHHTTKKRPLTVIKIGLIDELTGYESIGYGEIQAFDDFSYALENQMTSRLIVQNVIKPLIKAMLFTSPQDFAAKILFAVPYGSFAKAAVEMAVWDAVGKLKHQSLAQMIGGVYEQVPVGIAVGLDAIISDISHAIDAGYERIKIKVDAKNFDRQKLVTLLNHFPRQQFSLDANSSFTCRNASVLNQLPENVVFIEQPFAVNDFVDHATFQMQTTQTLSLDESINSLDDIRTMVALKAADAVTIKQAKIGGITNAIRAIDIACAAGIKPWIGGMLSSNIGRGVDLALASLPKIAFAGDISESSRYFENDLTVESFRLHQGFIRLPQKDGIGITLLPQFSLP